LWAVVGAFSFSFENHEVNLTSESGDTKGRRRCFHPVAQGDGGPLQQDNKLTSQEEGNETHK